MAQIEYRLYRCKYEWDGADYKLVVMAEKDWVNANEISKDGWAFLCFAPNSDKYIRDSFDREDLELITLALFKREVENDFGVDSLRSEPYSPISGRSINFDEDE